ncbi:CGNR zinc finger domain-containing protein [Amycolatopsis japonica]|uniref:CGNR zinc finger domain-containing protein n=1 Tax=Amycolatopsis japonica TaxID=208439 RepID=UPI003318E4CF
MGLVLQRPLIGEPLALDLLNTTWPERGEWRDVFDEPGGVDAWLVERGMPDTPGAEEPLRHTRSVLREVLENPGESAERALNEVLARGRLRPELREGGVEEVIEVDDAAWWPAWLAAYGYLSLLRTRPDRIKRCSAYPACTLYFDDTTRNGTRRWCSMETCGNRAKAARHYRREQSV